jgi:hypothetical protein
MAVPHRDATLTGPTSYTTPVDSTYSSSLLTPAWPVTLTE